MKWLWISGWAIPPAWFAAQAQAVWPHARHLCVEPSTAAQALNTEKFDALGGYSLGALWLLRQAKTIPQQFPVLLLAPIFAFPSEKLCGGRVALAQLRLQRRRLRSQPAAAVANFFQRAGLEELNTQPTIADWGAKRQTELDEELGWLEDWRAPVPPENWHGLIGANDALLDAPQLKKLWPSLQIVPQAGHAPTALLKAASGLF